MKAAAQRPPSRPQVPWVQCHLMSLEITRAILDWTSQYVYGACRVRFGRVAAIIWCIDNYKSATTPWSASASYGYVCFGGLSSSPDYIRTFYRRGIARSRLPRTLGLQWRSKPCSLVPRETCRQRHYRIWPWIWPWIWPDPSEHDQPKDVDLSTW